MSRAASAALTPHQQFLVARTDEAIRDGLQLARWCRETDVDSFSFPLDLGKQFRLANRPTGYYSSLTISGRQVSVMGCRQRVEFGRGARKATRQDVIDFMAAEFLPRSHWTYPDGAPGGFTVHQDLYRDAAGNAGAFPEAERPGCVDWRRLGPDLEWVMLTVNIHDFVMEFGPFKKRLDEAACVAPHAGFVKMIENPSPEVAFEYSIGYPFVKFAPIPNFFGFGPGKFGNAVKLYSMRLGHDGQVGLDMDFAAAPRCRKVLDFGPSWPDPVYGGAGLFEKLTLGLFKAQPFHDRLDAFMLGQHCRVHQALIDGAELIWQEWLGKR